MRGLQLLAIVSRREAVCRVRAPPCVQRMKQLRAKAVAVSSMRYSIEMTAPVPVSLASENTLLSMRGGNELGRMAWPLTRHRLRSHQRMSFRQASESSTDAFYDRRRSRRENKDDGGRGSMARSISRVRTRVALPTATTKM